MTLLVSYDFFLLLTLLSFSLRPLRPGKRKGELACGVNFLVIFLEICLQAMKGYKLETLPYNCLNVRNVAESTFQSYADCTSSFDFMQFLFQCSKMRF